MSSDLDTRSAATTLDPKRGAPEARTLQCAVLALNLTRMSHSLSFS
jgi:hypothetical protein